MNVMKRVVITGASSGIGKDLAEVFASNGHHLVLVARRQNLLDEIASSIKRKYAVEVDVLALDLALPNSCDMIFSFCDEKKIVISTFINNAGLGFYAKFGNHTPEEIQQTISLNISTLTYLSYKCLKHWKKFSELGSLLNVASVAAYIPLENYVVYAASKAYVKSFSLSLRYECSFEGINVSCLCPGGTQTEFFKTSKQKMTDLGEKMMMTSQECALIAYKGLQNKEAVIIPGFSNKLSIYLSKLFPEMLAINLSSKIFSIFMKK